MALKILTLEEQKKLAGLMYTLPGTVYLNQNRDKVVEEGSPEQFWQLGVKGTQIPMTQAIQLGLVESYEVKIIEGPAAKAVSKPEENKALDGPEENKAVAAPAATKAKKETKPDSEATSGS
jgi:hypothetical protein